MARKITWADVGVKDGFPLISPAFVANANDLVFTSGCVGTDPVTNELPEDLEKQARNAMVNLETVLKASGVSSTSQVLKILLFVSDGSYAGVVNKVFQEFFPNQPARSCIVVAFPNDKLKVELECIAEVDAPNGWFRWLKL